MPPPPRHLTATPLVKRTGHWYIHTHTVNHTHALRPPFNLLYLDGPPLAHKGHISLVITGESQRISHLTVYTIIKSNLGLLSLEILQEANHKEATPRVIACAAKESCNSKSDSTLQSAWCNEHQALFKWLKWNWCWFTKHEWQLLWRRALGMKYERERGRRGGCVCQDVWMMLLVVMAPWMGCLTVVLIIAVIYELVWCQRPIRDTETLCSPHPVSSPSPVSDPPKIIVC